MGLDKEIIKLKTDYSDLRNEIKRSSDIIRKEEQRIEKLKTEFSKKISLSVSTLIKNHSVFKKNLFIQLMKDPQLKETKHHRVREISVDSVKILTTCFDSSREIRMKVLFNRMTEVNLRLYKNFFSSHMTGRNADLELLVTSYLDTFDKLETMSHLADSRNTFTVQEYFKFCKDYNMSELYDNWDIFSIVSKDCVSKDQFDVEIKSIKAEETIKKTLKVLKR